MVALRNDSTLDPVEADSTPDSVDETTEITEIRRSAAPRRRSATRIEIDLDAVVANARDVSTFVGPSTGVLAVLKADAYGHGLVPVARALARSGAVAGVVVTSLRDALALRQEGVEGPVLVMGHESYAEAHGAAIDARVVPVVTSAVDLQGFADAARARRTSIAVHVKIDTGMSRLGVRERDIASFLKTVARCPITIAGLCTHLTSADAESPETTERQLGSFERAHALFRAAGHRPAALHAANTAAIFRHPRALFTHVRTGIALFGGDAPSGATLRPAMRFVTHVARLRTIEAGESVSYGERWRAARTSRIATLPIGYAHGYPRRLFGKAEVLVRGRRCPVVGAICMEMALVDVTDLGTDVDVGDEVVLFGDSGGDEIRATSLADSIDGIVEEIFCGIPGSVPREFSGV